jgi:predicted  nucleic acid-binding Zn-ribbon protein
MSILNDSDDTLFEDEKENASSNTPLSSTPTRKPSPISSVATQNVKSKEWKFEILELDEVQHDSPMFKERIKQVEEQMDDYILKLKRIAKITRQITTTSSALGKLQKQLGEELKGFTPTVSDTELEIAFDKFGNIFMELDHFREILAVQTEDLLSVPMENFIKQEIEEVREKKKKFERARSSFDAALSKASHMKKKKSKYNEGA